MVAYRSSTLQVQFHVIAFPFGWKVDGGHAFISGTATLRVYYRIVQNLEVLMFIESALFNLLGHPGDKASMWFLIQVVKSFPISRKAWSERPSMALMVLSLKDWALTGRRLDRS